MNKTNGVSLEKKSTYKADLKKGTEVININNQSTEQRLFSFVMFIINADYQMIAETIGRIVEKKDIEVFAKELGFVLSADDDPRVDGVLLSEYLNYILNEAFSSDTPYGVRRVFFDILNMPKKVSYWHNYDLIKDDIYRRSKNLRRLREYTDLAFSDESYRDTFKFRMFVNYICDYKYRPLYPCDTKPESKKEGIERFLEYINNQDSYCLESGRESLGQIAHASYELLITNKEYLIRRCKNCKRYFWTMATNEQFCDNPAPQDSSCTCKQMRRRSIYTKTKDDTTSYLINKIRDRKRKNMIRTPGDTERKLDYEKFRGMVKELRENYRNGIISQESFLKWLNAADETNITPDFMQETRQ